MQIDMMKFSIMPCLQGQLMEKLRFRFHFHLFQLILLKSPSLPPFSVYRCVRYWKETGVHAYYHYCIHCPTCQGTAHMEYATWYGVCMLYAVNLQISSLIASSTGS